MDKNQTNLYLLYIATKKVMDIKVRKISNLTLKHSILGQNGMFLGLTALVYLAFRVEGGSLELLYSLLGPNSKDKSVIISST